MRSTTDRLMTFKTFGGGRLSRFVPRPMRTAVDDHFSEAADFVARVPRAGGQNCRVVVGGEVLLGAVDSED